MRLITECNVLGRAIPALPYITAFQETYMKKYKDIIAGSVLLAFSLFYLSQTFSIKKIPFIDPLVGSALFPQIVASSLIFCSIVIIVQGVIALKKKESGVKKGSSLMDQADEAENGSSTATVEKKSSYKVVLVLGSFALFAYLMDKIGFGPASFLYLWSQMIVMSHEKQTVKTVVLYGVLSLVIATAVFCLFRYGFGLILPRALWF